jgi:hypothetical protein
MDLKLPQAFEPNFTKAIKLQAKLEVLCVVFRLLD